MGTIKIDFQRCKECGYCINFCPKKVLSKGTAVNKRGYSRRSWGRAVLPAAPARGCARTPRSQYIRKTR